MNKLVEEIIKPILEANPQIKKVVGIYGGRFQPFGPHHYKTYKWLAKQVDEAYITTSNIKKPPRHPMNYKEKVRHMSKMGVPSNRIIKEKSPYVAKNLAKKFNEETTAFVYVFGAKDAGRLGGGGKYFQNYKKNKRNLKGHKEHGYYLTAPHVSISVGGKEVSGTAMRQLLGGPGIDDERRVRLFKKMFGYYNKGLFQMMTNKFKKLFEADLVVVPYSKTRKKPIDPKLFDKRDKDLMFDIDLEEKIDYKKALKKLKIPAKIINNNHRLINYFSNNPQIFTQLLRLVGEENIKEDVNIDLDVGDTVVMGKFKNKKVVVKDITWNEKGDMLINGKMATKWRMFKKAPKIPASPFGEDVNVVKKDGKDGGDYRTYNSPEDSDIEEPYKKDEIDEFLTTIDMNKIIKEASNTGGSGKGAVDDGPSALMFGKDGYFGRNKKWAEKLGWEVVNYILDVDVSKMPPFKGEFGGGKSVTPLPAGIGTGTTPNNPENLTGAKGYNKWVKNMKKIAQEVGFELMDFGKSLYAMDKDEKELKKQISKDSRETLKQQKKDEKEKIEPMGEYVFSKDWWKDLLDEKIVTKTQLKPRRKELLLMGGAYGHMAHPFDDKDLTFGDLKNIITNGLGGQLNREDNVTEKLDGQNIMISWRDGKLIAARNKGHIKNGGATALTKSGIKSKFKGRGDIADAFNFAMNDLEKAISGLSDKQKDKIFDNGHNFMNMEVMWPKSANVIDYDKAELVFHGAIKYDDSGAAKGEVKGSGRMLAGMIKQINKHIGKKYSIGKPQFLTVPKHQDFGKMKSKFIGQLNKLKGHYGLKDNDTLALYHQSYWEEYIYNAAQQFGYTIPNKILKNLTKRWAFFDKSYKIPKIKKDLKKQPEFLDWVLSTDKNNHTKMVKKNMKPFETLFFEVGSEILKNVKGFMAANPDKAVQGIRKRLDRAISSVRSGGDLKKLNKLKTQLDKLQAIGGTKAIVPSEGIVFKYNGKTYKFTGAFAPINQIAGLISF